jgi:RNA polymerase sigma factor (sigma-70 family)
MTNDYNLDNTLLEKMRSDAPTADNAAFLHLSKDPSVKTRVEQFFEASESKNVEKEYIQMRAFQSLTTAVRSKKFELKGSVADMYVSIVKHLLEAEPIRTGESPLSDRILKALYTDKTVINTIRGTVKDYKNLNAQDILDDGFSLLYESIVEDKFGGRCTLRTYFIGICKTLILESASSGRIKKQSEGETLQVKRVILMDTFEYIQEVDDMSADFRIELEEKDEAEQLRERLVQQALNSGKVSETCKEALVLQYIQELSMAQIAVTMKIALQSAKNQAARCREQLRRAIDEIEGLKTFLKESL